MGQLGISADLSQTQLILAGHSHVWTSGGTTGLSGHIWSLTLHQVRLGLFTWQMGRVPRKKAETIQDFWKTNMGMNTLSLSLYSVGQKSQSPPKLNGWRSTHQLLTEETAKSNCKWCVYAEWWRSAVIFAIYHRSNPKYLHNDNVLLVAVVMKAAKVYWVPSMYLALS